MLSYSDLFRYWRGNPDWDNRWKQPGDELRTDVPSLVYPTIDNRDFFYTKSQISIENAGSVRLDNIMVRCTSFLKLPEYQVDIYGGVSQINKILWKANRRAIDPDFVNMIIPSPLFTFGVALKLKKNEN